jgi:hypothetical protein
MSFVSSRAFAVVVLLSGCPSSTDSGGDEDAGVMVDAGSRDVRFVGDPALPPEAELVIFDGDSRPPRSHDEATVLPLQFGIQGGFMILVGAKVRNMDIGTLQITGTVGDDCFAPPRAIGRTGNPMFAVEEGGWGVPDPVQGIAAFLNLQLCPNLDSSRDADGHPYDLEVRITDRARRSVLVNTRFTATCAGAGGPGEDACECQCDDQSTLGADCSIVDLSDVTDPAAGSCPQVAE